ncbi:MAG: TonB-dependent receptor [Bacteroidota bacterium]
MLTLPGSPVPRLLLAFLAALVAVPASAQSTVTLSGFVRDADSRETLIGASVYAPSLERGAATNAFGFFSLTLPQATEVDSTEALVISFVGYEPLGLVLDRTQDQDLDIALVPDTGALGEAVVTADRAERADETTRMGTVTIAAADLQQIPVLLGEADVLKALQLLPGVQGGTEGTSGFYVRGGGPDQNLLLLDGAPVYNASHLFGFFSVFNGDALQNVELVKGGFPARYGGRLSSVVDMRMREGNQREIAGKGSVGLIASRLTVEGPIVRDKASFIVSGRRTYADLLARPFIPEDQDGGYYFWDLNAKANAQLSPRDRVFGSFYGGQDRFFGEFREGGDRQTSEMDWGNTTGTLRYTRVVTPQLFVHGTLLASDYGFNVGSAYEEAPVPGRDPSSFGLQYRSGIRDFSARVDAEWSPRPEHAAMSGVTLTHHRYRPGAVQVQIDDPGLSPLDTLLAPSAPVSALEAQVYVEDDWRVSRALRVNLGLHASVFNVEGRTFSSLEPRLAARYRLGERTSVKASWVRMRQYVHLLTNSGIGLPTDLWVPATDRVPAQSAWQGAIGAARTVGDWSLEAEAYWKEMDGLIEYREGTSFLGAAASDWEAAVTSGSGRSVGLELLARKTAGRTTGWIGYTLANTNRTFPELNRGETFPFKYDRRHDIGLTLQHRATEGITLALTWVYGTGSGFTAPTGRLPVEYTSAIEQVLRSNFVFGFSDPGIVYAPRNSSRLPDYHRMDLGLTWRGRAWWGEHALALGVYNVYARRNPFFVVAEDALNQGDELTLRGFSLFQVIPSIAYQFDF